MPQIFVMAGLVPAIHVFLLQQELESKAWMPGIKPGMTALIVTPS